MSIRQPYGQQEHLFKFIQSLPDDIQTPLKFSLVVRRAESYTGANMATLASPPRGREDGGPVVVEDLLQGLNEWRNIQVSRRSARAARGRRGGQYSPASRTR